jgi:hypothetical protein
MAWCFRTEWFKKRNPWRRWRRIAISVRLNAWNNSRTAEEILSKCKVCLFKLHLSANSSYFGEFRTMPNKFIWRHPLVSSGISRLTGVKPIACLTVRIMCWTKSVGKMKYIAYDHTQFRFLDNQQKRVNSVELMKYARAFIFASHFMEEKLDTGRGYNVRICQTRAIFFTLSLYYSYSKDVTKFLGSYLVSVTSNTLITSFWRK